MSLHDLFDDVADAALASRPGVDVDAVLVRARGHVRAARRRRAASVVLAAAAVVVLVVGLQVGGGHLLGSGARGVRPAAPHEGAVAVPTVIFAPPAWTPSVTDRPVPRAVYLLQSTWVADDAPYATTPVPVVVSADDGSYRALPTEASGGTVALSPDGTRVAWRRDAGVGAAGEAVVVLELASGVTRAFDVPSPSGQGASVGAVTFTPASDAVVIDASEPVGDVRSRALYLALPRDLRDVRPGAVPDWRQVCACSGPLGWADDGTLLVASGITSAAAGNGAPIAAPVRAVVVGDEAASHPGPNGTGVDAQSTLLRIGGQDLVVEPGDGPVTVRAAGGAALSTVPPFADRSDPTTVWQGAVVAAAGRSLVLSRWEGKADGAASGTVQRVDLADLRAPRVSTLSAADGGRVSLVAAAGLLVTRADARQLKASAPARAADPDWWRYQVDRGTGAARDGLLGGGGMLLIVLLGASAVWWWGRRGIAVGVDGARSTTSVAGGAPGEHLASGRWGSSTGGMRLVMPSGRRRAAVAVACTLALVSGAVLLVMVSVADADRAQAHHRRAPATTAVVPASLSQWPARIRPWPSARSDQPRRLSMLLSAEAAIPTVVGVDAADGTLVSLAGAGGASDRAGLDGEGRPASLSPGGTVVAEVGSSTLSVLQLASGTLTRTRLPFAGVMSGGSQGRLSDVVSVADDGTVLVVSGRGALWRLTPDGAQTELTRFGRVQGVAAQPSGRFLVWRHFDAPDGPARLDLVEPSTGAVLNYMTWPVEGGIDPVAAEGPGAAIVLRADDGRLLLHRDDDTPSEVLGRLPQVDWIGAGGDGSVVSITAPEAQLAVGASVAVGSWAPLGGTERADARAATTAGRPGVDVTRIDLPDARVALAPAVIAQGTPVVVDPDPVRFAWTRDGALGDWLVPLATWLGLGGLVGLLVLAATTRVARTAFASSGRATRAGIGRLLSPRRTPPTSPS